MDMDEGAPSGAAPGTVARRRSWTRREVLRDPRFYMILPGVLAPGFIVRVAPAATVRSKPRAMGSP